MELIAHSAGQHGISGSASEERGPRAELWPEARANGAALVRGRGGSSLLVAVGANS
jgi:hypothetical protein